MNLKIDSYIKMKQLLSSAMDSLNYSEGLFHTHVSLIEPKGKFQLSRNKIEEFWDKYYLDIKNGKKLGIAEKPQNFAPVLADVDILIEIKEEKETNLKQVYTNKHVLETIKIYQNVLKDILHEYKDTDLTCVLLEKPPYVKTYNSGKKYIKNGFHLHFPSVFLSKANQEIHLIQRVRNIIKEQQIFSDIGIEDSSEVIDKSSCSVPWLLYGGRKHKDMDSYNITKVYNYKQKPISLEEAFSSYKLYDVSEDEIKISGDIEKYIPRILSIIPFGRKPYNVKDGLICPVKKKKTEKTKKYKDQSVEKSLEIAKEILPMLSNYRADDRNEWIYIGWALYSIGNGSDEALDLWIEFSSRCTHKFNEASCIYEWEKMEKKNITIGTLKYYAKLDNPKLYEEYQKKKTENQVENCINASHNDIAKILYEKYGEIFVCASVSSKTWFKFEDNYWHEIEEGICLRKKISSEIPQMFSKIGANLYLDMSKTEGPDVKSLEQKTKLINKTIANLKSSPFKSNVMKEAMEEFYNRKFRNMLDSNPDIIAFQNGVYDLKQNIFRDGRPDDYISKTMPIDYKDYKETDNEVEEVVDFLQKVFPDETVRKYFLDVYSDIFVGGNTHKKVYLWTGEGDNGKSITQKFFELMLGQLSIKFNTQYFTGKKVSSGSANPELSRAGPPVRLVTMEEPDSDEQLNIGELKKLSGGDSFWARDLFQSGKQTREIFPMFMLTFICNKLPKLRNSDNATWNRLRVIPFESTFVEKDYPSDFKEQMKQKIFPMDKNFNKKIKRMVPAFAWYLLNWRKTTSSILVEPPKVKNATNIYKQENDIYSQYINENIIDDKKSSINITELYAHFKEWFREGNPNITVPIKNVVRDYLEKLWGESQKGVKWVGKRLRTLQDDIDSGDAIVLNENDLSNYL